MTKKLLPLFLCLGLLAGMFSGCRESSSSIEPETAQLVETSGTFENENLSFKIPVGWKAEMTEKSTEFPTVTCEAKGENSYAPFIDFHWVAENNDFLNLTAEDLDYSDYYTEYALLENAVKQIKGRDVLVTRFKGTNAGTTVYVKAYMFNDSGRTYTIALSSPEERLGFDELYTIYDSFSGKPPASTTTTTIPDAETTTLPDYNIQTGNFLVKYPETWISDVSGRNQHVQPLQYWYGRRLNNVPVFVSSEEINGFFPYISVVIGNADRKLVKWDDKSFDLSASFKNYEQGAIERSTRNGEDMVTLNYSVENEDGTRIYIKQILFNQDDLLFILSLFTSSQDYGYDEFQEFYDTFYVLES